MKYKKQRLGAVAEFINGMAFKPSDWSDSGLPIIRIQNLTNVSASFNNCAFPFHPKYRIDQDDLLVSWSATLDVFIWKRGPALLNQHIFRVNPRPDLVSREYLYYALKNVMSELRSMTHGATMKHITKGLFENTTIPLPPLSEQHRIVRILDKANDLRKLRAKADERTRDLIPAIFYEMFGDPATNPKKWKMCSLAQVGTLDRGKSKHRPRDAAYLYGGSYPFVQTGDVANSGGVINTHTQTYSEAGLAQSRLWPAETLCITIAANIGKTGLLSYPACFPDSVVGFIPGESVLSIYVREWFTYFEKHLEEIAPQAAQKNINLKILRELHIPVPPLSLQREFATRVEQVRAMQEKQAESRKKLDALFESLLHRAFAGEL